MKTTIYFLALALLTACPTHANPTTVTITSNAPIEQIQDNGTIINVTAASIGQKYNLSSYLPTGDIHNQPAVILADAAGLKYKISAADTDFVEPTHNPSVLTPPTTPVAEAPKPSPTVVPPPAMTPGDTFQSIAKDTGVKNSGSAPSPTAATTDTAQVDKLNSLIGLPLFTPANIWQTPISTLAKRLAIDQAQAVTKIPIYRSYQATSILGATTNSILLYGQSDNSASEDPNPLYLSIIFNSGGSGGALAIQNTIKTITDTLTPLLGAPTTVTLNDPAPVLNSEARLHQEVSRWDTQGTAILLTNSSTATYVSLKLMSSAEADKRIQNDETTPEQTADALTKTVQTLPNGDVTITALALTTEDADPNYRLPNIWERILNHYGIWADMVELSQVGDWSTQKELLPNFIKDLLRAHNRKLTTISDDLRTLDQIKPLLDKGIPLVWESRLSFIVNRLAIQNTRTRATLTTPEGWDQYAETLKEETQKKDLTNIDDSYPRTIMIIGYNATTNEIEVTGTQTIMDVKPTWIYLPIAQLVNGQKFTYVDTE
jgi:hypothetical protein